MRQHHLCFKLLNINQRPENLTCNRERQSCKIIRQCHGQATNSNECISYFLGSRPRKLKRRAVLLSTCGPYHTVLAVVPTTDMRGGTITPILEKWLERVERQSGQLLVELITRRSLSRYEKKWSEKAIEFIFTKPYKATQNGVVKRLNRLVLETSGALLCDLE